MWGRKKGGPPGNMYSSANAKKFGVLLLYTPKRSAPAGRGHGRLLPRLNKREIHQKSPVTRIGQKFHRALFWGSQLTQAKSFHPTKLSPTHTLLCPWYTFSTETVRLFQGLVLTSSLRAWLGFAGRVKTGLAWKNDARILKPGYELSSSVQADTYTSGLLDGSYRNKIEFD